MNEGERDTRLDPVETGDEGAEPTYPVSPPSAALVAGPTVSTSAAPDLVRPNVATEEVLYPSADLPSADLGANNDAIGIEAAFVPRAPRAHGGWPFVTLAPLLVVVVGFAVALGILLIGLDQLARAGEEHAASRAELLAATVAARLGELPLEHRFAATQLAGRRSAAELLVVTANGEILHDATLGPPDPAALARMLESRRGVVDLRMGRARYAVRPVGAAHDGSDRLVVFVPEPRATLGGNALVVALTALVVLLVGVAAAVAYAVSRDVARDVEFVTDRVRTMAQVKIEPTGELIPCRTMDEVGLLTAAFNKLVGRFGLARAAYREDLTRASAADRERAAFLAAVSHELRSPLNAILGFADILMEEVDGPLSPSAQEEVEQIRGSGAHLLSLINDILEFSALESGQLRLSRSRVDLLALAKEVVREARGLIGDRPLVVRVEGEEVVARADGRRIRQVLGNLVNNAIKFTQRGEVVVLVRREGMLAALLVRDTGPGISAQERGLIFDDYKQARSERVRRRGTGLGLAIARRLVMLHRGEISVESELGRGATFKVLLPVGTGDAGQR